MSIFGKIIRAIFGGSDTSEAFPISRAQLEAQIAKLAVNVEGQQKWRTSIVDLLKVLGIPSDFVSREELARELGYKQGKFDDSAEMNTWLHEAVMKKLCETGGKIPDSFKD